MTPAPPIALYDACVLYPSLVRNLLMHLAVAGLVAARWTDEIHDEWGRNLLLNRPDLGAQRVQRIRALMDQAVPDARVTGYETLIAGLSLPVPDDRHVLAAAIHAQADVIVTLNLKDFPRELLEPYGVQVMTPDTLLLALLEAEPLATRDALEGLRRSSPFTWEELTERLTQAGLTRSVADFRQCAWQRYRACEPILYSKCPDCGASPLEPTRIAFPETGSQEGQEGVSTLRRGVKVGSAGNQERSPMTGSLRLGPWRAGSARIRTRVQTACRDVVAGCPAGVPGTGKACHVSRIAGGLRDGRGSADGAGR